MTLDLPALIEKARDPNLKVRVMALKQLRSLQQQGVVLPPSAVTLLDQWDREQAQNYEKFLKTPAQGVDDVTHFDCAQKPEPRSQKESELQSGIVSYLQGLGWYVMQTFVGSKRGGSVWMHKGLPDLICIKDGQVLFLEVKRPSRDSQQTPEQKETQREIQQHGGICEVVRSIMDVHNLIAIRVNRLEEGGEE
ncbi:VRR-NUC domain-containing protein [Deinococcus cellulosilyticus]|uniref:VRR-NUC domain-containing protein n=1 Tax=Deinococcus cellulosilyticus (strain DSM 18568 / NBRC 106333 / KACC 11606 / 5516J-15) TaxID=1223518 RepID=A0A511MZ74_DEIC1|nr:VRR-NUC domain-containing protein [Deinococcus cellulosilyticus]GEM45893.1 hypothetical protein DC3_15280 [Deinococcus cellulosilyticus NBRC 106333 = KACC 11606]